MKTYLKRSKLKIKADAPVERGTVYLSEPIKGKRSKPGEEGVELGEILKERVTSDPEQLQVIKETREEQERVFERELSDVDAKLQTMLFYYNQNKTITPELQDLIDTLFSVYINENKEEVEELEFEAKYKQGRPIKDLFNQYFFDNINDILSSYDNLKHGIYTLNIDYPTQLQRLKGGI